MNLQNKVIVITGASQGLGAALAKKVAEEGAKVALVARSEDKLQKLKEEIGESVEVFICDVRDLTQVKQTVKAIVDTFGTIDILFNNAGIWTDDALEKEKPELRRTAFDVNVLGNIQVTEEVLSYFKTKNAGYIFNNISTSGDAETPSGDNTQWKAYGASKWAFAGYTKALRESLINTKIKVTAFFPGGMDTNLYENAHRPNPHNQPWMMKPEEIVDVIIFALTRPDDMVIEKLVVTKVMD